MSSFRSMGCEVVLPDGAPVDGVQRALRRARPPLQPFHPELGAQPRQRPPLWRRVRLRGHGVDACCGTRRRPRHRRPGHPGRRWRSPRRRLRPRFRGLARRPTPPPRRSRVVPSLETVSLRGRMLLRTEPLVLDLNGVVKGRTVDDALALLGRGLGLGRRRPRHDRLRSASGCLAAARSPSTRAASPPAVPASAAGAAAALVQHHLIDPATGAPARTPWRDVTVAAGSCLAADVAAKAALLLGAAGPSWLDRRGLAGRFVDTRASCVNESWRTRSGSAA